MDKKLKLIYQSALEKCPLISIDEKINGVAPCIKGTRITITSILSSLNEHGSIDGVIKDYPHVSELQIKEAIYFAELILRGSYYE